MKGWPRSAELFRVIMDKQNFASQKKEASTRGIRPSLTVMRRKLLFSRSFFPHVLEIAQPDFTRCDSTADGTIRTLSWIDRACINLPVAEARDFHCNSHVFENLAERSIPSDHAAVRVVIQKPANWCHQVERIASWMSKHPVFCSILKQISDPDDPFVALAPT